jgi:hypothetical protein
MATGKKPAKIMVDCKSAKGLIKTSWFSVNDPYTKMWTNSTRNEPQRGNTHKSGGDRAIWDEKFVLTCQDELTEFLFVEVINDNGDKLIGRVRILCADIPEDGMSNWFKLYNDSGKLGGKIYALFPLIYHLQNI